VRTLGTRRWKLPKVDRSSLIDIQLELSNGAAQNSLQLLVMPAEYRKATYTGNIAVIKRDEFIDVLDSNTVSAPMTETEGVHPNEPLQVQPVSAANRTTPDLERSLHELGYKTTSQLMPDTNIAVTNYMNPDLLMWVRNGGDLLFLSSGPSPFFWAQGRGGIYSGGWITAWSWLRADAHKRLGNLPNPLSMPFMVVTPSHTMMNLPYDDPRYQNDFLAGQIAGWVAHPAVHTVQFRYGKGRVIQTTFALRENLLTDPVAPVLFHDLIDQLLVCDPNLKGNW
jgi:hypothetical protein